MCSVFALTVVVCPLPEVGRCTGWVRNWKSWRRQTETFFVVCFRDLVLMWVKKRQEIWQGQRKNGEPVVKGNATGMTNGCLLRCLQDFVLKNAWCEATFFQLQLVCSHECVPAIGLEESDSSTILSTFKVWCFHWGPCHICWTYAIFQFSSSALLRAVAILQNIRSLDAQKHRTSDPVTHGVEYCCEMFKALNQKGHQPKTHFQDVCWRVFDSKDMCKKWTQATLSLC